MYETLNHVIDYKFKNSFNANIKLEYNNKNLLNIEFERRDGKTFASCGVSNIIPDIQDTIYTTYINENEYTPDMQDTIYSTYINENKDLVEYKYYGGKLLNVSRHIDPVTNSDFYVIDIVNNYTQYIITVGKKVDIDKCSHDHRICQHHIFNTIIIKDEGKNKTIGIYDIKPSYNIYTEFNNEY